MGLFSGLKKIVGAGARGIGGIVKKTIKKVKKAANFVAKKFKGFASELGPLGTIALIGAAIYFTGPAGAGYWGTGAAQTTAIEGVAAQAATSGATGAATMTEGLTTVAATAETGASLGSLGLSEIAAASETGMMAASQTALTTATAGTPGLGILAPEYLSAAQSTGVLAEGAAAGFDYVAAGKKALSLLGGGADEAGSVAPYGTEIPSLQPAEAVRSLTSGQGGGLGFSKFTEEAQSGLTGAARQAEEQYKSLLARGSR